MKREQRNEMCKRCGKYRAIYQYHGGPVRRRRDHDYCPKCWRAALNAARELTAEERFCELRAEDPGQVP